MCFGETFALELVPQAKIIYEVIDAINSDSVSNKLVPFQDKYFSISAGFITVVLISLVIYAFDFDKFRWYQPIKAAVICGFVGTCLFFFIEYAEDTMVTEAYEDFPYYRNWGFIFGVLSFSFI